MVYELYSQVNVMEFNLCKCPFEYLSCFDFNNRSFWYIFSFYLQVIFISILIITVHSLFLFATVWFYLFSETIYHYLLHCPLLVRNIHTWNTHHFKPIGWDRVRNIYISTQKNAPTYKHIWYFEKSIDVFRK